MISLPQFSPKRGLAGVVRSLFGAGEQGAWYDPSDSTTLFQDAAGTTPVTAVEQPVGLMLDKSKGLVLGPELVTNGGFDADLSNWSSALIGNATLVWNAGAARLSTNTTGINSSFSQNFTTVSGRFYRLTASFSVVSGAPNINARIYDSTGITQKAEDNRTGATGSGQFSLVFLADAATMRVRLQCQSNGAIVDFDNISVRELPGNHAFTPAAATTSRPVLSARVNLLTKTEQFDDAAWSKTNVSSNSPTVSANAANSPLGTATADRVTFGTINAAGDVSVIRQLSGLQTDTQQTGFVYLKAADSGQIGKRVYVYLNDTAIRAYTPLVLTSSWQSVSVTGTYAGVDRYFSIATAGSSFFDGLGSNADSDAIVDIWGADLRVANDGVGLEPYQRVDTATSYTTTGFPQGERYDGSDDHHITAAGGGGTSAFFFCASIRLGRVGATQTIVSDTGTNTGYRVRINSSNQLEFSAGNGSAYTTVNTTATLGIGERAVITCWHDGTNLNAQINNGTVAQAAFATATAGTAQITLAKDNNATSSYFLGSIYQTVYVKDEVQTAAEIAGAKQFCATKAKVTL